MPRPKKPRFRVGDRVLDAPSRTYGRVEGHKCGPPVRVMVRYEGDMAGFGPIGTCPDRLEPAEEK